MRKTVHRRKKMRGGSRKHRKTLKHLKATKPVITIGLIHASWCGHCKALQPEWKRMKRGLHGTNCNYLEIEDSDPHKDRKIAHVNSRLKGEKLAINGYPTVFKVRGGNLEYYQGERTAQAMQQWFKGGNAQNQGTEPKVEQPIINRMFGGCGCNEVKPAY